MEKRLSISELEPQGYRSLFPLETYLHSTPIDPLQKELIKLRASQVNGCAYCLNMHSKDGRRLGETEQRIYCLNVWRQEAWNRIAISTHLQPE